MRGLNRSCLLGDRARGGRDHEPSPLVARLVATKDVMTDVDGLNAGLARGLLEEYLENPDAVPTEWRQLFESGDSDSVATPPGLARLLAVAGNGQPAPAPARAATAAPEQAPA